MLAAKLPCVAPAALMCAVQIMHAGSMKRATQIEPLLKMGEAPTKACPKAWPGRRLGRTLTRINRCFSGALKVEAHSRSAIMFSRLLNFERCLVTVLCAFAAGNALAQASATPKPPMFSSKPVQSSPVTGDPSKEILLLAVSIAPTGAVPTHVHPGDCVGSVVEGSVELIVEGKEPRRLSAGDSYANPRGTVHSFRNTGDGPARLLNTLVVDKGAPPVQPVAAPPKP
jgi:quercetin dioxygenase-like cupin family protein